MSNMWRILVCFNPLAGKSFGKDTFLIRRNLWMIICFNPLAGKSFGKGRYFGAFMLHFVSIPLRGSRLAKSCVRFDLGRRWFRVSIPLRGSRLAKK